MPGITNFKMPEANIYTVSGGLKRIDSGNKGLEKTNENNDSNTKISGHMQVAAGVLKTVPMVLSSLHANELLGLAARQLGIGPRVHTMVEEFKKDEPSMTKVALTAAGVAFSLMRPPQYNLALIASEFAFDTLKEHGVGFSKSMYQRAWSKENFTSED